MVIKAFGYPYQLHLFNLYSLIHSAVVLALFYPSDNRHPGPLCLTRRIENMPESTIVPPLLKFMLVHGGAPAQRDQIQPPGLQRKVSPH